MDKACSIDSMKAPSCVHDNSGAASLPRKAQLHHKMLALLPGLPLPGFFASCFVQTVEVGKAWDSYIASPTHTAQIFSGFSVGCCINKEKVIYYQLKLGK